MGSKQPAASGTKVHAGCLSDSFVQYVPLIGDVVIGLVVERFSEGYKVDLRAPTPASLNALAFEGATKRNRPHIEVSRGGACLL